MRGPRTPATCRWVGLGNAGEMEREREEKERERGWEREGGRGVQAGRENCRLRMGT